ncbi:response regulator [candidate division TA06 bacterium]|uniref:Response regulator n=1 Tax=candidate division TA06 bacterium TaxID=2250710 RepID=A0A523UW11_UNCT6|nr:MAG: response regulator [candidate division TA06 bacterium]
MVDAMDKTIGITDADSKWLTKLRRAFERLGFSVITAENGSDLLVAFRNSALSILIADTQLKDMRGLELISTIRELDSTFPIVVTTSDYSDDLEIACRKLGIVFYARKPLNFEIIRWIVARHLCSPQAKREIVAARNAERN